jgi:hypothetical protein
MAVCRECIEAEIGRAILRTVGVRSAKRVTFEADMHTCNLCGSGLCASNSFNAELDVPLLYLHFSVCPMSMYMLLRAYGARVDLETQIRQIVDKTVSQSIA